MDDALLAAILAGACLVAELVNMGFLVWVARQVGRVARAAGPFLARFGLGHVPAQTPPPTPVEPSTPSVAIPDGSTPVKTPDFLAAKGYQSFRVPDPKRPGKFVLKAYRVRAPPPSIPQAESSSAPRGRLYDIARSKGYSPAEAEVLIGKYADLIPAKEGAGPLEEGTGPLVPPGEGGAGPGQADPLEYFLGKFLSGEALTAEEKQAAAMIGVREALGALRGSGKTGTGAAPIEVGGW